MKHSREVKVGIVVVVAIFLLYFGLNFLKGIDIFSPTRTYYGHYDRLDGLVASSPVYIKGCKVGQVDEVTYDFSRTMPFVIRISVDKHIDVPASTVMQIYDDGLLGGKAVQLLLPEPMDGSAAVSRSGDTLQTDLAAGLIDGLLGELSPQLAGTLAHVDSLVQSLNQLAGDGSLRQSIHSIELLTHDLQASSARLKSLMNNDVPQLVGSANSSLQHIDHISGELAQADLAGLVNRLDSTADNLHHLTDALNSDQGTLGLLLNDPALYDNLNKTVQSADALMTDLKQSPKRYVSFSLFGGKKNK